MKKISYIIPLVAMLTLTGCGSQSSSGNTTSSAGPKKVSFEFWHTLGQGLQEGLVDAIAEFETIINIKLEFKISFISIMGRRRFELLIPSL